MVTYYVKWDFWVCHSNDMSLRNFYGVNRKKSNYSLMFHIFHHECG